MSNLNNPVYKVLRPKKIRGLPPKITCFALNYATHRLMVCNKQDLYLYDLENQSVIDNFNYAKKFEKIYDSEVRIKSLDAIIMSGLWVALVNKKSLVFFNDKLEFSKIYSAEPNPALGLHVIQRTHDIVTLRADRKMLKFWRFEMLENLEKIEKEEPNEASTYKKEEKGKQSPSKSLKSLKADINFEKHKPLTDKGQSFEVSLYTRKNLTFPPNRIIMSVAFSEELYLTVITLDTMEVLLHHLLSGDILQTLSFSSQIPNELDYFNAPIIAIDQEILYYCDDKKFVVYDLILRQEVTNFQHNLPFQVFSMHAERSNPNGGIYLVSEDDCIHCFSYSSMFIYSGKILWTESINLDTGRDSPTSKKGDVSPTEKAKWYIRLGSFSEAEKKNSDSVKERFCRSRFDFISDTNSVGLTTLFTMAFRQFKAYDLMSPGKICLQTEVEMVDMTLTALQEGDFYALDNTEQKNPDQLARITFQNHKFCHFNVKDFKKIPNSAFDILNIWKTASYESNSSSTNPNLENIEKMEVLSVFQVPEEKVFILVTQDHLHAVSMFYKRRLMQRVSYTDVTVCTAICLNQEHKDLYYVVAGTSKGVIMVFECNFILRHFSILKNIIRHDKVLALRYVPEVQCLLSIGTEGNIFLYDIRDRDRETSLLFPVDQSHKLIWNQATAINFLTDSKIIAGFGNGIVQCVHYNWKQQKKFNSDLLEYHGAPIQHIAAINQPAEEVLVCCGEGIITYWHLGRERPIKIFRLADPITSMFFTKKHFGDNPELYIGFSNLILKLDYTFGTQFTNPLPEHRLIWNEAIACRMKNFTKAIRESKTATPKLARCVNALKAEKQAYNDLSDGPMLYKFIFEIQDISGIKSLESDFSRYVSSEKTNQDKSRIWILDIILSEFFERRINDQPLIPKPEVKNERKTDGPILVNLVRTLKKYPIIKSIILEKFKNSELVDYHKNIVLLLNHVYHGEDNLEEQYKFLETKYNIKREELSEIQFIRAKTLYYKKEPQAASEEETEPKKLFKSTSKPINLPPISKEPSPPRSGHLLKTFYSPPASPSKLKPINNPVLSYTQYSRQLEKELTGPVKPFHGVLKSVVQKNDMVKFTVHRKYYQPYKSQKDKKLKLSLTSSNFPSPSTSGLASPNTACTTSTTLEPLGIGQAENTLISPAFTSSRADFYKTVFITEPKPKKEPKRLDYTMYASFPKRSNKDFVASHSKGFTDSENADLYKHVLRHLIKNYHLLLSDNKPENSSDLNSSPKTVKRRDEDDSDIEYIPITIKQFILESTKEQMALLNQIPYLYEMKTGSPVVLDSPTKQDYNVTDVGEKLEKENVFLEEVLQKINEKGIESVNIDNMTKFKKIVKRRLRIFTQIEQYIHSSGLLNKEDSKQEEAAVPNEILETVQRIQEIRTNLGIEDIPKPALYSGLSQDDSNSGSPRKLNFSGLMSKKGSGSSDQYTNRIVDTILESVAAYKTNMASLASPKDEENLAMSTQHSIHQGTSLQMQRMLQNDTESGVDLLSSKNNSAYLTFKSPGLHPQDTVNEEIERPGGLNKATSLGSSPKFYSFMKDFPKQQMQSQGTFISATDNISKVPFPAQLSHMNTLDGFAENSLGLMKQKTLGPDPNAPKKKKKNPNTSTSSGSLVTVASPTHGIGRFLNSKNDTQEFDDKKSVGKRLESITEVSERAHQVMNDPLKHLGTVLMPSVFTKDTGGINIGMLMKGKKHFKKAQTMGIKNGSPQSKKSDSPFPDQNQKSPMMLNSERPRSAPSYKTFQNLDDGETLGSRKDTKYDLGSLKLKTIQLNTIQDILNEQDNEEQPQQIAKIERHQSLPGSGDMEETRKKMEIDPEKWKTEMKNKNKKKNQTKTKRNSKKFLIADSVTGFKSEESENHDDRFQPRKSMMKQPSIETNLRPSMLPIDKIDESHVPNQSRKNSFRVSKMDSKRKLVIGDDTTESKSKMEDAKRDSLYTPKNESGQSKRPSLLSKNKTSGNLLGTGKDTSKTTLKVSGFARENKAKAEETTKKKKDEDSDESKESDIELESSSDSPKNLSTVLTTKSDVKDENGAMIVGKKATGTKSKKSTTKKTATTTKKNTGTKPANDTPKSGSTNASPSKKNQQENADNGQDSGKLSKIEESPQEETLSARQKKKEEEEADKLRIQENDDLLDDPLALFNQVLKEGAVDEQTKLDLYLYGNRKQALKDYVEQLENNLEFNILSQKDCQDQLANFFDGSLSKFAMNKNLTFSNPLILPYVESGWDDDENPIRIGGRRSLLDPYGGIVLGDFSAESVRKKAFIRQKDFIAHLKMLETKNTTNTVGQTNVSEANSKKAAIILSHKIIDTLLFQGNSMLNIGNSQTYDGDSSDISRASFENKIRALREILRRLKAENPPAFIEMMRAFDQSKQYYQKAIEESQRRKITIKVD